MEIYIGILTYLFIIVSWIARTALLSSTFSAVGEGIRAAERIFTIILDYGARLWKLLRLVLLFYSFSTIQYCLVCLKLALTIYFFTVLLVAAALTL